MGGGVSLLDVNNDGLQDIFMTGNMTSNKLYLNAGGLSFTDITESAGLQGDGRWYTGTTIADVNSDGWMDIYVCVAGKEGNSRNQLYVNQQDNTFIEQAEKYGIADNSKSIQASFFDYDKDGLVDLYVANYAQVPVSMGNQFYKMKMERNSLQDSGHLYKNMGASFKNVTAESGLQKFGLSLGLATSDFNSDGYPDLYISNDFNVPDYFFLNNGDGTFSDELQNCLRHTSMFGMGCDAGDFNNDGNIDFLQVDMTPEDHVRAKTNMASMSSSTFYEGVELGFHYQYMQNSLQVNQGVDAQGLPQFSEVARFSGLATTDWSWGALFCDLNNDGWKDVFISNGMKRDVNNNDAIKNFTEDNFFENSRGDYQKLPSHPIANYAFENDHNGSFNNVKADWGLDEEGFSNGFSIGDLDNDGDLDIVINNLDAPMSVYENLSTAKHLQLTFEGPNNGLGARVEGDGQVQENYYTRGFQSSVPSLLHFGLGDKVKVDSLVVFWPDGKVQRLYDVQSNQKISLKYQNAADYETAPAEEHRYSVEEAEFIHVEDDYDDFALEPLLPHRNSKLGPSLAVGDVDNDGDEDFFIGGASSFAGRLFLQKEDHRFQVKDGPWNQDSDQEDTGASFLDVEGDGDLDLYIVSGGNNPDKKDDYYQDRLYINNGSGEFTKSEDGLPRLSTSGQEIVTLDVDNDNDLDILVLGRISPGYYPYAPKSFLLVNEDGKFSKADFPEVGGMVTAAIAMDFNSDGWMDIVLSGEWMGIQFYQNTQGRFTKVKEMEDLTGWYYSLAAMDADQDGDLDLVAGNLGLNYKYKAPFEIYANDFDENKSLDIVLSYEKDGKKLPLRGRECSSEQVPAIAERFGTYESFANADLIDIYGKNMLEDSKHFKVQNFASLYLENKGGLNFEVHELPKEAQYSSINCIQKVDYNNDEYPDLLLLGNLLDAEVETTRNDASLGVLLKGGAEGFKSVPASESGLYISGCVRNVSPIVIDNQRSYLLARNDDALIILK